MDPSQLLPGDIVQARLPGTVADGQPAQTLVTLFPVAAVSGTVVTGTVFYPDGIDSTAGWEFDVIQRTVTLPDSLCEITATLQDGTTVTLMGKGDVWSDATTGAPVAAEQIIAFTLIGT